MSYEVRTPTTVALQAVLERRDFGVASLDLLGQAREHTGVSRTMFMLGASLVCRWQLLVEHRSC